MPLDSCEFSQTLLVGRICCGCGRAFHSDHNGMFIWLLDHAAGQAMFKSGARLTSAVVEPGESCFAVPVNEDKIRVLRAMPARFLLVYRWMEFASELPRVRI